MKNSLSISLALAGFSAISFFLGSIAFILCTLPLLFVLLFRFRLLPRKLYLNKKMEKFSDILFSESKITRYVGFDARNEPVTYGITTLIWLVSFFYLISDLVNFGYFEYDIVLMFFSAYLVTLVMVLYGYIQEYDKL